jgi:hypothetical protein
MMRTRVMASSKLHASIPAGSTIRFCRPEGAECPSLDLKGVASKLTNYILTLTNPNSLP